MDEKSIKNLEAALKYGLEQERASFEKAIDDNPLEATNHLVYADWLQEQGEHEESEFRRAMGKWIGDGHLTFNVESYRPVEVRRQRRSGAVGNDPLVFPEGVDWSHVPTGIFGDLANDHLPRLNSMTGTLHTKSYRDMESALRKAFQAGRQKPEE